MSSLLHWLEQLKQGIDPHLVARQPPELLLRHLQHQQPEGDALLDVAATVGWQWHIEPVNGSQTPPIYKIRKSPSLFGNPDGRRFPAPVLI
ncbi:hypothetical protein G7939_22815 (plasmid) [Ralstonia solanacearum]|uniref:hypothetical protein n=1 Tax=Ralstonia pseudosolanacearum TaxID=1310165 RepID=UPI00137479E1|nr:hypothetical protein [Ralstonia pseudosolanacearum]MCK4119923.1 hypothetical protein [Ralstonia pseudosolanacearum]QIK26199.1 hypothetical protein G7939_22815 [Ralstonia solanacearum]QIK30936.1 hypothetical protein G7947_21910 [Ralstonia solanacearum]QIK36097.1 hypothetical protein G7969_23300 [Ralstonia solanacearum]